MPVNHCDGGIILDYLGMLHVSQGSLNIVVGDIGLRVIHGRNQSLLALKVDKRVPRVKDYRQLLED